MQGRGLRSCPAGQPRTEREAEAAAVLQLIVRGLGRVFTAGPVQARLLHRGQQHVEGRRGEASLLPPAPL